MTSAQPTASRNQETLLHTFSPQSPGVKTLQSAHQFDSFIFNATADLTPITAICSARCP